MDIFTGLGLALPAGLNAYIPLLTIGLLDRFTNLVSLNSPYDLLSSNTGLIALTILLVIEIVADAVPVVDSINDVVQTAVRPAAGAIAMMATSGGVGDIHPFLLIALGVIVSGSVHGVKAATRPAVTAGTGGAGNPLVSTGENFIALVVSVLAILVPVLAVIAIAIVLVFLISRFIRWKQWSRARREA